MENKTNLLIDVNQYEKGLQKRLTIDGKTQEYQSYFIPIERLYYNDLNGRISTYIEEYNDLNQENISNLYKNDKEKYNDLIAKFIIESANDKGESFKNTKNDIHDKGQQNPGVILSDGRIIDGNRRFTAIRELYKETGNPKFSFFEAVVLDAPSENNIDGWKTIKTLELYLQFNVDEKKGYNTIDFLVSFYKDVMNPETRMFDTKQYAFASGKKPTEIKQYQRTVNVMLDYLEWINKPRAFYILKNEKLDGPLEEIAKKTNKMSDEEWMNIRDDIYNYLTHVSSGDRTREVRELLNSAKNHTPLYEEFSKNMKKNDLPVRLAEATVSKGEKSKSPDESARKKQEALKLEKTIRELYNSAYLKQVTEDNFNEPVNLIADMNEKIGKIDIHMFKNLPDVKLQALKKEISLLERKVAELKESIFNE